jgi:hypothetical protein
MDMRKTLERILIEQCAPTLAGLKTGNVFNYQIRSKENVNTCIAYWNDKLARRGICMAVLRQCGYKALIYVYRKRKLAADLRDPKTAGFLKNLGYDPNSADMCVRYLKERIDDSPGFPHEIGLFLGYPLHDVIGFIENSGKNFHCCGCWKVYCDQYTAKKRFDMYKKCRSVYLNMFQKGKSIMQLTVSA